MLQWSQSTTVSCESLSVDHETEASIGTVLPLQHVVLTLQAVMCRSVHFSWSTRKAKDGSSVLLGAFALGAMLIKALTQLSTPNSFAGTSLLILVGVATDTWRQLQAELLMQQYATDVDRFSASTLPFKNALPVFYALFLLLPMGILRGVPSTRTKTKCTRERVGA
eukprot:4859231-Amphidinium_carterae.1